MEEEEQEQITQEQL